MSFTGSAYSEVNPTGTTYSNRLNLFKGSLVSVHVVNTGLTGTLTLWQSNVPNPDLDNDDDWVQNTDVSFTALAGTSKEFINAGNAAAHWYRVKYVHTSGSGSLVIYVNSGEA